MLAALAALPPPIRPEMWLPGVVSTPLDEFGGALAPDGREFYFSISVPRFFLEAICSTTLRNGRWTKPKIVPWSGTHHDFDPCLSPDGKRLFFISDRPVAREAKKDYDVWAVERRGAGWGPPSHLPSPVNSPANEHFASAAANGDLYVCSDRDGVTSAVYRFPFDGARYGAAERLPAEINGEGWTLEAAVSPDGQTLVCATIGRKDSRGLYDLYASRRTATGWTPLASLGPEIDSAARDYSPRISTDGRWLFYASEVGFANRKRTAPLTYRELNEGADSLLNGYGNVYRVPMDAVLARLNR